MALPNHDNIIHYGPEEDIEANIFTHNDGFRSRSPDTVHFSPLTVESVGGHQGVEFWEAQEQAWIPFEAPKLSAFANFKKFYKAKQEVYASFNTSPNPVSVQERNVYYSPTCVVCLENPPVKVVWPCRHACLCRPYARRLKISSRCPVCRQEYQKDPESEAERRSWEEFQEDMAVLDSLDRIMDDPGKSEEQKAEARRKYEDYVRKMNERNTTNNDKSGCSCLAGGRNGVATLLKAESQLLVAFHCIAHRLALAVGQAGEAVSYFRNSFKPNLGELSTFFDYSACRMSRLHQIQDIMNLAQRPLKEAMDTRWLSHDEACSALYKTLPAVLTRLDHEAPASIKLQAAAAADQPTGQPPVPLGGPEHGVVTYPHILDQDYNKAKNPEQFFKQLIGIYFSDDEMFRGNYTGGGVHEALNPTILGLHSGRVRETHKARKTKPVALPDANQHDLSTVVRDALLSL
ncbi:hypothetical protein Bbelb_291950 [Branchiostoma belcheri]|nr:hypothetical protein Bbelb_291950 [Branchiostoma belcheri]